MSSQPELLYFRGRGTGEIVRLVLTAAGIKYTETEVKSRDQFQALLPELLFKQIPLLRIDGINLVQSNACVRYIGRKHNMLGCSLVDMARVDELYEGTRDFFRNFRTFGLTSDDEKVREVVDKDLQKYLPIYDKILTDNNTGYLVGSGLTIADLGLFDCIEATIDYYGKERLQHFSGINLFYAKLTSLTNIQTYLREIRNPRNDPAIVQLVTEILARQL